MNRKLLKTLLMSMQVAESNQLIIEDFVPRFCDSLSFKMAKNIMEWQSKNPENSEY